CDYRLSKPVRDGVDCRPIWVSGRAPPSPPTASPAASKHPLPTANGLAIWRRGKPDALLHHSDRGSQYTSEQFQKLMADQGVVCSMSRSGNVWDNAAMESFFSSLKTERTLRKTYRTRDEARADVFDYIERFYNAKRRHSTIGYRSPLEFEMQAGLVLAGVIPTWWMPDETMRSNKPMAS